MSAEKYALTETEKSAKKSLERALKKLDDCGLSFVSVVSGTTSSLKILTPKAYRHYTDDDEFNQYEVAAQCEVINDHGTWEGEIVT